MAFFFLSTVMLLAAFFLRQAMEKLIVVSGKRWKRLLLLFGCWILLATIIFIGDPVNILLAIFFLLVSLQIAGEGSFRKKLVIGLMFSSTVFAFNTLRDNYIISLDAAHLYPGVSVAVRSICTLPFTLLLYMGIRKIAPDREYWLSESMWKLLLLLTATPLGIVMSIVVLHIRRRGDMYGGFRDPNYLPLLFIALFSIIGLLWAVTVLAKQQKLEEQNMLAEINQRYYEAMEQQHFAIRRLKHDLANHLSVLAAMPEEQREAYIRDLTEDSSITRSLQYCGDSTVNAVLSVKKEQMERYGIRLEAKIEIPQELPFGKTDLCALFANALDNAAEACGKLEEDRRKVLLKSKAQKGLFCLEVTNPIDLSGGGEDPDSAGMSKIWKKGSFPLTSKPDKENHGIGLRSMKEIVERYGGGMEIKTEEEIFEVFLYMPMR